MAKTKGIDSARLAIFKQDEETIDTSNKTIGTTGIYKLDEKTAQGMTVGNITGLTPTMTKIYGSDMVVETSGKGVGSVQATVGANDIPEDVIDAITGVDNTKGFSVVTSDTRAPYSVIEFITHGRMNNILHFALLKGTFGLEEHNMQTNTESENLAPDSLTFTGVNRQSDKAAYAKGDEANQSFKIADWTSFVFPGSVASSTNPA